MADQLTTTSTIGDAPVQLDQEWANALTHGLGFAGAIVLTLGLTKSAYEVGTGMAVACAVYGASVIGTFLFSMLSHSIHRQPILNTLRAWDQAMIYLMIAGTYTPIIAGFASDAVCPILLTVMWVAAGSGFFAKVVRQHRVNSIATISYLLLGWLPAMPIISEVPSDLLWLMVLGGGLYTIGVALLMNDHLFKYAHAVWHLIVISAALIHWYGIRTFVIG